MQSKLIALDRNVVLELVLQKVPDLGKPTGRLPGSPPVGDDAMVRPTVTPRRTLDTSNPYAK